MDLNRYLSQIVMPEIFPKGQRKISESSVIVVGVGGTGSVISELLVRLGIGKLSIIDPDVVEISNLNRQSLYDEKDVGRKKVFAALEHLHSINSDVKIIPYDEKLTRDNAQTRFAGTDVIMDGTDNYGARGIINEFSVKMNIPWVFTAVEGYYGYVKIIIPHKTSCLACMGYPLSGESIPCTQSGVMPITVFAVSAFAVSLAVKAILGNEVTGELNFVSTKDISIQKVMVDINPDCRVCGVRR